MTMNLKTKLSEFPSKISSSQTTTRPIYSIVYQSHHSNDIVIVRMKHNITMSINQGKAAFIWPCLNDMFGVLSGFNAVWDNAEDSVCL